MSSLYDIEPSVSADQPPTAQSAVVIDITTREPVIDLSVDDSGRPAFDDRTLDDEYAELVRRSGSRARDTGRLIDLGLGIPILLFALPVLAVMALAVRLDSAGPLLFRQERIGRDGRRFSCLKMRTMRPDAEERLAEVLAADPALEREFLATRKLAKDPRVTRVGRFLRPTGLDELPQLWNVIRGDMSLVGPRPRAVSELAICGGIDDGILAVRPGLTGPWQVSGRNEISDEQREAIELDYARNRSFLRDVGIVLRTVFLLLTCRLRGGS